ncbi:protein of unknown function [Candidatus Methylocalor cossyra]|uniref:Uncharacterized protein n=1 Tax=Candidatus Methylocalor cossyra TaxID=3108543 RepID=A0ABM9NJ13_9GAMM
MLAFFHLNHISYIARIHSNFHHYNNLPQDSFFHLTLMHKPNLSQYNPMTGVPIHDMIIYLPP